MTTHNGPLHTVHRQTLIDLAHTVGGTDYIGGRGVKLADAIRDSAMDEANELTADLAEVVEQLDVSDCGRVLGALFRRLAGSTPSVIARELDDFTLRLRKTAAEAMGASDAPWTGEGSTVTFAPPEVPNLGVWTHDGATGGPVPPAPPQAPSAPETAPEAPILGSLDDPPPPVVPDGAVEDTRAAVTDYLNGAERAAGDQAKRPPAKAQASRARGRARKAASGG